MSLLAPFEKFRPAAGSETNASTAPATDHAVMAGTHSAEISITLRPGRNEKTIELFRRLATKLWELDSTVVSLILFGRASESNAAMQAMGRVFGNVEWPITWIDGAACDDNAVAGVQAFAFSGDVHRLRIGGRVVGSVFEDGAFRHCWLGGLTADQTDCPRADQTKQTLDQLQKCLSKSGFLLGDVIRTWFYLEDLLAWYDDFNRVRTQFYSGISFRTGSLPASTGIGARNPAGSALVAGAWAVQPLDATARAMEVASPLQCPAPAYGSSFSRAMEIASPAGRRLTISGTASIAPDGRTLWPENIRLQINQTMKVVEAILRSRGFEFSDVTRAIAYFKHRDDARVFAEWCDAQNVFSLPAVLTHCDVCRDNLLFELEADAWRRA